MYKPASQFACGDGCSGRTLSDVAQLAPPVLDEDFYGAQSQLGDGRRRVIKSPKQGLLVIGVGGTSHVEPNELEQHAKHLSTHRPTPIGRFGPHAFVLV